MRPIVNLHSIVNLKLILTGFLLCVLTSLSAQSKYEFYGQNKKIPAQIFDSIASFYELIVTDIDQANVKIDSLKKSIEQYDDGELMIDLLMLESELYRSKGDFIHMKLSIYEGISWKTEETSDYHNLLIEYYLSMNEAFKDNDVKQHQLLKKVNASAKKKGYEFILARSHFSLGKYYANEDQFDLSQHHLQQAKRLFEKIGFKILAFDVETFQGISYFWEGKSAQALSFFHKTKKISSDQAYKKCYLNSLLNLGEAHLYIDGSMDSARYYLKLFLQNKADADIRDEFQCYADLEEYYNRLEKTDSAYHYSTLMHRVENRIRENMLQSTNEEIDNVFKKLQNERKLTDEKNEQRSLKLIFGLIGLFLLCLIVILWVVLKEKSRFNFVLMEQKDDIMHKKKLIDIALKEKELLLKEIHHRVKNNLQIISSLLSLQSKNIEDDSARIAILEGKERIQAIALIHQKLYQDDTFASIEMEDYLGDLIEQLSRSYNEKANQIDLSLKTNDIILNIDTVVPLGLIICELTTNAFKYAFENKSEGKLKIEISRIDGGFYQLSVKDNGNGMPQHFDFLESKTLGVEIILALTEQLEGEVSYKSTENGTSFKIKFKEIKA